ncbi:MAG: multidrug efflux MFS transporter [Actinobacteria bacterium]|nr:multidrug efflux MFS transporter [Actinomycetota bacterium]
MSSAAPDTQPQLDPAVRRTAMILVVGALAAVFDTTIMSVALHTLSQELRAPISTVQWVTTGYVLALAATVPLSGWLQRFLGGKNAWMLSLLLFLAGSVLCSLSWNAGSLIAFRVLQGVGAGIMMPLMMSIVMQAAGGRNLGRLSASIGLPAMLGPILGPAIGGIILNWLDWRWIFLVNVPFCVVGLVLAWLLLAPDQGDRRARLDVTGMLLLVPALVALLIGLSNSSGTQSFAAADAWPPLAIGGVLLVAFVVYAMKVGDRALVDVRLLAKRPVWSSSLLLLLSGLAAYGIMLLLPLYLQELRQYDVLAAGLFMIPQGIGTLLARPLAGRLVDTIGPRWVAVVGFSVVAITTIPFALSTAQTNEWLLMGMLLIRGVGLGGLVMPLMVAPMQSLTKPEIPHATIITRTAQQLGGSFGTAILAVVLQAGIAANASHGRAGVATAFDQAFWWSIGFTSLAVLIAFLLPGRPRENAAA